MLCAPFEHRGELREEIDNTLVERCMRARAHIYRDTLLSSMILYRFLFVLQLLVPLHVSRLAPIKAAPVAIGIKRSIHESTLFRARLQDLLMVMGARVPVGSRASRSCGDYLRWLFEGQ